MDEQGTKNEINHSAADENDIEKAILVIAEEIEKIDHEIAVLKALRSEILARCEGGVPF